MPLLHYFCIILRRNSLLSVTNIATQENTIVATPQSGCNTSLLQLQVMQFQVQTKLLQFWAQTNCCNSRCIHGCCNSRQTIATPSTLFIVATPNKSHQHNSQHCSWQLGSNLHGERQQEASGRLKEKSVSYRVNTCPIPTKV
jgi:hypothetical protein